MIDCGKGVMKEIKKEGSGAQLVKGSSRSPCFSRHYCNLEIVRALLSIPDFSSLNSLLVGFRQGIHVRGCVITSTYDFFGVIHLI